MYEFFGEHHNDLIKYSTVHGIECHMNNNITYPILRHMLSYTNNQQLHHQCHLIGVQVHLLVSCHECVQQCREVHAHVTQWFTS